MSAKGAKNKVNAQMPLSSAPRRARSRRALAALLASLGTLLILAIFPALASATFGIQADPANPSLPDFHSAVLQEDGVTPYTQAGGHPYEITTSFNLNSTPDGSSPEGRAKDIQVDLPAGFVGNPTATATCAYNDLQNSGNCPIQAQVGVTAVRFSLGFGPLEFWAPVYNMEPAPGDVATFAFNVLNILTSVHIHPRTGSDYGVRAVVHRPSSALPLMGSTLTLWGVPADPTHDSLRGVCLNYDGSSLGSCPANTPPRPFLRNPTDCSAGPQTTSILIDSYEEPENVLTYTSPAAPVSDGCDSVPFDPSISVQPTSAAADTPTGLHVDIHLPQNELPTGIATSDLKSAAVNLPPGMAVSPAAAAGQDACSPAQIALHSEAAPGCPDASKLGTVEIDTPLLANPLRGSVFLAKQNDNPFGSTLAIYVVAAGPGVVVKLAGRVEADAASGQLTTRFEDNPQLPFEDFKLDFFAGPRAALVTPPTCGSKTTSASLTPWGRPEEALSLTSSFQITSGPNGSACPPDPAAFSPKLDAGVTNPVAGAISPFALKLTREDGTQHFKALDVSPPPGVLASLKGVPYCPQSALDSISTALGSGATQLAIPSCPAASQIGTVVAGAGAGPNPFYVQSGRAYLAGPYKGAPLSLAAVIPAAAGPFDLGSVLVRSAIAVDPETARITVRSDSLPQILAGIPLDVRDIRVNVDRPDFTLNPTSCDPMGVNAQVTGSQGAVANLSNRFQVGSCGALDFKPNLALSLKGPTHRRAHPSLHATLTAKPGEANIARAQVKLPKAAFLDNAHIGQICTRPAFSAHSCPPGSVYGHAEAITPLLDAPLSGNVYLRANPAHRLPDLVADLNGQIEVALAGRTDSVKGALRNTFEAVPDAPVTKFTLTLFGGKRGLIEMSDGFCASPKATVKLDGQNGKIHDTEPVVQASACAKRSKKSKRTGR